MKLLYCTECDDVVRLVVDEKRSCLCGETAGQYTDERNAVHSGGIPFGFDNGSFAKAILARDEWEEELGIPFEAFIIPEEAPTLEEKDGPVSTGKEHDEESVRGAEGESRPRRAAD